MTRMKKLASLLLAMVMALALAVPALAVDEGVDVPEPPVQEDTPIAEAKSANVTVSGGKGHELTAYQIFEGGVATGGGALDLRSIKWGQYVVRPGNLIDAINAVTDNAITGIDSSADLSSAEVAQKVATVLAEQYTKASDEAKQAIAKAIAESNAFSAFVTLPDSLMTGYCVIVDKITSSGANGKYILKQIDEEMLTVSPKSGKPGVEKEVSNTGDNFSDAVIGADEDGNVTFKISVTLPDNLADYKEAGMVLDHPEYGFYIRLHDTQSKALTFVDGSLKGYILDAQGNKVDDLAANLFDLEGASGNDGCSFEILVKNVQNIEGAEAQGKIVFEYKAALNVDEADTGTQGGNTNHVTLETPDPERPETEVNVYVLEFDLHKVDGTGEPLSGAEFTLTRIEDENGNLIENPTPITLTADETGSNFQVKDLKPGKYTLVESKVPLLPGEPEGGKTYNKMDDITFTITAKTDKTPDVTIGGDLDVKVDDASGKIQVTLNQLVDSTIENVSGIQLPEAGGIGTTIFYILGGILVVGAAVLLITKRRMGASEE